MTHVRPATLADYQAWYDGAMPPSRIRAWVVEEDGKVIAIGGLKYGRDFDVPCVFAGLSPVARAMKKTLHRCAKEGIAHIMELEPAVVALRDESEPTADRWLRRLGFEPICRTRDGEVYWHG